ncbi:unnamed protein product, partial [Durusdinium trenchii]
TWTEVDDAIHKAFLQGSVDVAKPLAQLVQELSEVTGPGTGTEDGLPASPSQGLARLECLTPRPFYLPEQVDLRDVKVSGAPQELPQEFFSEAAFGGEFFEEEAAAVVAKGADTPEQLAKEAAAAEQGAGTQEELAKEAATVEEGAETQEQVAKAVALPSGKVLRRKKKLARQSRLIQGEGEDVLLQRAIFNKSKISLQEVAPVQEAAETQEEIAKASRVQRQAKPSRRRNRNRRNKKSGASASGGYGEAG